MFTNTALWSSQFSSPVPLGQNRSATNRIVQLWTASCQSTELESPPAPPAPSPAQSCPRARCSQAPEPRSTPAGARCQWATRTGEYMTLSPPAPVARAQQHDPSPPRPSPSASPATFRHSRANICLITERNVGLAVQSEDLYTPGITAKPLLDPVQIYFK